MAMLGQSRQPLHVLCGIAPNLAMTVSRWVLGAGAIITETELG